MDPEQEKVLLKLLDLASKLDADVIALSDQAANLLATLGSLGFEKFNAAYLVLWIILVATVATLLEASTVLYRNYRHK